MIQTEPVNPITAVTHSNPYLYYKNLVINKPLYYDKSLQCWVASSSKTVHEILNNDKLKVRPKDNPIPKSIARTAVGDVFGNLIRMNDGTKHILGKDLISLSLNSLSLYEINKQSNTYSAQLYESMSLEMNPERLSEFIFRLPIAVVSSQLNIPDDKMSQIEQFVNQVVLSIKPNASSQSIDQGNLASRKLKEIFDMTLFSQSQKISSEIVTVLLQKYGLPNYDKITIIDNVIGLLVQTYEATTGLIGNTLKMLGSNENLLEQVKTDNTLIPSLIQEVVRFDPPVQNTRRYVHYSGTFAGQHMYENDVILVILAAANRDPSYIENPDVFDIHRKINQSFTFGSGKHACPGELFATTIALSAVKQLILDDKIVNRISEKVTYIPSSNLRIPLFREIPG